MGYDLTITKDPQNYPESKSPFTRQEILDCIDQNHEYAYTIPDERYPNSNIEIYFKESPTSLRFIACFYENEFSAKNPTNAQIVHLIHLAQKLNATVIGEEYEIYTLQDGKPIAHNFDGSHVPKATLESPPIDLQAHRRKDRIFLAILTLCALILVAKLYFWLFPL